jgi:hypothetical protein
MDDISTEGPTRARVYVRNLAIMAAKHYVRETLQITKCREVGLESSKNIIYIAPNHRRPKEPRNFSLGNWRSEREQPGTVLPRRIAEAPNRTARDTQSEAASAPDGGQGRERDIERTLREPPPLRLGDPFLREDVGETQRAPPPPPPPQVGGGDEVDMANCRTGDPRRGGRDGGEGWDSNGSGGRDRRRSSRCCWLTTGLKLKRGWGFQICDSERREGLALSWPLYGATSEE